MNYTISLMIFCAVLLATVLWQQTRYDKLMKAFKTLTVTVLEESGWRTSEEVIDWIDRVWDERLKHGKEEA